jgi:hypothetical protein
MFTFSTWDLTIFFICFTGFFVLAGFAIKHVYERRLRARLQDELNHLFLDYIPLEGEDIETITFSSDRNNTNNNNRRGAVV